MRSGLDLSRKGWEMGRKQVVETGVRNQTTELEMEFFQVIRELMLKEVGFTAQLRYAECGNPVLSFNVWQKESEVEDA